MKIVPRLVALAVALLFVAGVVVYFRPDLLPPGRFHPRSLVHWLKGEPLHPWVSTDPGGRYVVRLWDIGWPVFRKDILNYEAYLEYAVQGFTAAHPNVRVEVKLFGLAKDEEYFIQTLALGERPDVISGPFHPWMVRQGMLADLTAFFDDKERAEFLPGALSLMTWEGRVWGYPRWLDLQFILANAVSLHKAGIDPEAVGRDGWTWEQFIAAVEKIKGTGQTPLILNTAGLSGLEILVRSLGGGPPFDASGNLVWAAKEIEPAVALVSTLTKRGIIPSPPSKFQSSMVERFWSGQAAMLGPVDSGLLRHLRERNSGVVGAAPGEKPAVGFDVALLPFPRAKDAPPVYGTVYAAMVLEHEKPDQMKAAADVARYLARTPFPKMTSALQFVSCHKPELAATVSELSVEKGKPGLVRLLGEGVICGLRSELPFNPPVSVGAKKISRAIAAYWDRPTTAERVLQALHKSMTEPLPPPPKKK